MNSISTTTYKTKPMSWSNGLRILTKINKEGMYLNYVEKHYGFKLLFNRKSGDGEKRRKLP